MQPATPIIIYVLDVASLDFFDCSKSKEFSNDDDFQRLQKYLDEKAFSLSMTIITDSHLDENGCLKDPATWKVCRLGVAILIDGKPIAGLVVHHLTKNHYESINWLLQKSSENLSDDSNLIYPALRTIGYDMDGDRWRFVVSTEKAMSLGEEDIDLELCLKRHGRAFKGIPGSIHATRKKILENRDDANEYSVHLALAIHHIWNEQKKIINPELLMHLYDLEFPASIVHAHISWNGLRLSEHKCQEFIDDARKSLSESLKIINQWGIEDPDNEICLKKWILDNVPNAKKLANNDFDSQGLKEISHLHPIIPIVRQYRKAKSFLQCKWIYDQPNWNDGRVHPQYLHLHTATGRSHVSCPEVAGIAKKYRPIVVPDPGNGIIELDYGSMEIAVAAGLYDDEFLTNIYNTGDAIDQLSIDLGLQNRFENQKEVRSMAKQLVYGGLLYGAGIKTISVWLKTNEAQANVLFNRLKIRCKQVSAGMKVRKDITCRGGYVPIFYGLRRKLSVYERRNCGVRDRIAMNTPIQGAGSIVFRRALIEVQKKLNGTSGEIIMGNHDAILIEAPLPVLPEIRDRVKEAMILAFKSYFPRINMVVKVKDKHAEHWYDE